MNTEYTLIMEPIRRVEIIDSVIIPQYEKMGYIGDYMRDYLREQVFKLFYSLSDVQFSLPKYITLIQRIERI